jgi:predicted nucleic acid-binding protein
VIPKRILVDANFLVAHLAKATSADDRARIEHFLDTVEKMKSQIIIPMPAMAEYLVRADEAGIVSMNELERKKHFLIAPFDRAAAFECALLDRAALGAGDKKDGAIDPWQKVKIDRQIVAIGKANGARLVISGDAAVRSNAIRIGMDARTVHDLELPQSARQGKLALTTEAKKR